jgi:two-component system sensor histidine kinase FlrB
VRGGSSAKQVILLNSVFADFAAVVMPQVEMAGATLLLPAIDDTLSLEGDRDALVGVLCNLVMNALELCTEPAALEIWVGALNAQYLQISVRDNGPGIAEDIIERIFDPFFTTRAQGTGLGLAVVDMVVGSHGGQITAANRPCGGAEFLLTLPIATAGAPALAAGDEDAFATQEVHYHEQSA